MRGSSTFFYSRSGRKIEMHRTIACVDRPAPAAGRMAVLCMVLAGAGFGCATQRSPFVDPENSRIVIEIDNRTFEDATVHAIWEGRRVRLGRVTGTMKGSYVLPVDRSIPVYFEIDLFNGPECTTRQIWADPGDIILLQIDSRTFGLDCRE